MITKKIASGLIIEGDLIIRRIEHGIGSIAVIEISNEHKRSFALAEILADELLDRDDTTYADNILFGKARITVEKYAAKR